MQCEHIIISQLKPKKRFCIDFGRVEYHLCRPYLGHASNSNVMEEGITNYVHTYVRQTITY